MDKKMRRHMEWKNKLEIFYDAFNKGLGIRPIARKYGLDFNSPAFANACKKCRK